MYIANSRAPLREILRTAKRGDKMKSIKCSIKTREGRGKNGKKKTKQNKNKCNE